MTETAPELHPFADAPATLELRKESWRKETLGLVGDGKSFGRIDYGVWSGKGRAEAAGAQWVFDQKGIVKQRVEIAQEGADEPLAEFDMRAFKRGGTVELAGATYGISASGVMKERWVCEREGRELFALQETGSLGKGKGAVEVTEAGRADPNIALLVLLAVHVNRASDVAASTATTAAT